MRGIFSQRRLPTTMEQWIEFMGGFLKLNDYPILQGVGKVSKEQADEKALTEYNDFRVIQDRNYVSDFEKLMQQIDNKQE
jgi:hypothetical protein